MKKSFWAYYIPNDNEFGDLWSKCLFIPDTNMLLNIYCYSETTQNELIGLLEKISDRIWIPYQVGYEYQKQRHNVILSQERTYDDIKKAMEEAESSIKKKLDSFQTHTLINKADILKIIKNSMTSIQEKLDDQKSNHPDLLKNDPLRDRLTDLFAGKVGQAFPSDRMDALFKEGEKRYKKRIPPGYADEKKDGDEKYGDYILWLQIIEKAKETKKPIIFITNDDKEDWWLSVQKRKIGPRPELREEIFKEANVAFYMYSVERFMEYSKTYIKSKIKREAIDEVKDIRKQHEDRETLLSTIISSAVDDQKILDNVFAQQGSYGTTLRNLLENYGNISAQQGSHGTTGSRGMALSNLLANYGNVSAQQGSYGTALSKALGYTGDYSKMMDEVVTQKAAYETALRNALAYPGKDFEKTIMDTMLARQELVEKTLSNLTENGSKTVKEKMSKKSNDENKSE